MGPLFYCAVLAVFGWSYALRYPWLLGAVVVVYLCRGLLPDPYVYARTSRRIRRLRAETTANPDNATARRDLAMLWLERRRPRKAIPLLVEARRRAPDSAEITYLLALAHVRAGEHTLALPLCIEAAEREPKLRYGEIYLTAGIALLALSRTAEAEDALLRFLRINASSVEGWVRLAKLRRQQGDADGARAALTGAVEAFELSPKFRRRRELGWYLRARAAALFA